MRSASITDWFRPAAAALAAALLWNYLVAATPTTNGGPACAAFAACQEQPRAELVP